MEDLLFKDECFEIIGLCYNVHNTLGNGFHEFVYQEALEIEFRKNQIPYEKEKQYAIIYNGVCLQKQFRADFVVFDNIILELKAQKTTTPANFKQTLNYLAAAHLQLGLLINFGEKRLRFQRVVL